jgi:cytochrome c peroxidase
MPRLSRATTDQRLEELIVSAPAYHTRATAADYNGGMRASFGRLAAPLLGVLLILAVLGTVVALAARRTAAGAGIPLGLYRVTAPAANPTSPDKVELGRLLYFDPRLSADGTVSCATCHAPAQAFADPRPVSIGVRGGRGTRNSPTVINAAYLDFQFWDGRARSLEQQAAGPITNPVEMANTAANAERTLSAIAGYAPLFTRAFGSPGITMDRITQAIAAFERTVLSGNSAYDRYKAGDERALTDAQLRGLGVFVKKGQCSQCHTDPLFTDGQFHNIGVGMESAAPDPGRYTVTKNAADRGAFRTPPLREVARTAPYMHDGSMRTLAEVVDFYDRGGTPNPQLDPKMTPLGLTAQDKRDLIAFLEGLSGEGWQRIGPPAGFPQ